MYPTIGIIIKHDFLHRLKQHRLQQRHIHNNRLVAPVNQVKQKSFKITRLTECLHLFSKYCNIFYSRNENIIKTINTVESIKLKNIGCVRINGSLSIFVTSPLYFIGLDYFLSQNVRLNLLNLNVLMVKYRTNS